MIRYKRFILIVLTTFLATLTIYGLTRETKSNIEFNEPLPMRNESVQSVDHLDYLNASINPLDGCYHVYLDVGTNVGIQIRKLYEPQLYPGAESHKLFQSYFKRTKETLSSICTVGFEPNPAHTKRLQDLEDAYNRCGWKVWILQETAVADFEGTSKFFSDNDFGNLEWGGTIIDPSSQNYRHIKDGPHQGQKVRLIRLSTFINQVVAKRRIPSLDVNTFGLPKVLMKMDIEGSEVEVLPDLLRQKSLEHLDGLMIEYHIAITKNPKRKEATTTLKTLIENYVKFNNLIQDHQIESLALDDESYYLSRKPLPQCTVNE